MAEEHKCQSPPEGPRLCANNCGFFGSPATLDLCSKCYRDFRLKEEQASSAKMAVEMAVEKSYLSGSSTNTTPTPPTSRPSSSVAPAPVAAAAAVVKPAADAPPTVSLQEAFPGAVTAVQEQQQLETADLAPVVTAEAAAAADVAIVQQPPSQPPQPTRCSSCRKRVGLTGFRCRCGETFCGSHRYPEHHSCTFDFKSAGKDAIARANPVVKARKLDKI